MLSSTALYSFPVVRQKIGKKLNRQRPYQRHQWRWGGGSYYPVSLRERAAAVGGLLLKELPFESETQVGERLLLRWSQNPLPTARHGWWHPRANQSYMPTVQIKQYTGHCLVLWKDLAIKDVVICPNRRVMNRQAVRNKQSPSLSMCLHSVHSASTYSTWYCGHKALGGGEGPEGDAAWGRSKHQTSKRNYYCQFNNANNVRDSN